jgi:hypothetical protein
MNSLSDFFDQIDVDTDDSDNCIYEDYTSDLRWRHLSSEQIGDIQISSEAVDGMIFPQAKDEIRSVCRNARRLLNKATNSDVSLSDLAN